MTNAQIRIEIAKLEEIKVTVCDNHAAFEAICDAIQALRHQLYAGNPVILRSIER